MQIREIFPLLHIALRLYTRYCVHLRFCCFLNNLVEECVIVALKRKKEIKQGISSYGISKGSACVIFLEIFGLLRLPQKAKGTEIDVSLLLS